MNIGLILNILGSAVIITSLFMTIAIIVSFIYSQPDFLPLVYSFLLTFFLGCLMYFSTIKNKKEEIRNREAFLAVTLTWLFIPFLGAIPFLMCGMFDSFTDAYFEAMAGFTTTGASVLKDIESQPLGVLFWRSMIQWLGGMGIIVFALAILPMLGSGGMQLFKAEVPEITVEKLRPRIIDTAKALWFIYVFLTLLNAFFLLIGGMDIYNSVCHAFTTLATGGFSTKNASIGHYENAFIHYTTSVFMFLAGVNYSLYFGFFKGRVSSLWKANEFRFYIAFTLIATVMITINIYDIFNSVENAFRHALFQVTSILTTTGYSSTDFGKWHPFSQIILVIAMLSGGMIGSTAGGIKQVRILLMLKQGYREIYQLIHPRAVLALKLDEKFLTKEMLGSIWGFIFLFLMLCVVATLVLAAMGIDLITSATAVVSATANVGPALGQAGPAENYAFLPDAGKWVLIFCMLAGRLEIYTVLILFVPAYWRK